MIKQKSPDFAVRAFVGAAGFAPIAIAGCGLRRLKNITK